MTPADQKAKQERPSHHSRNVALASGIAIALLVGYLTVEAFRDGAPAAISFEIVPEEGWTVGTSAYVPIDVRNTGGQTAAAIEIETKFDAAGAEPIVTRTIIDFLAGGELQRFYAVGPPGTLPTIRLIGFQEP